MGTITRPGKEGNTTTYQGKVAAGYTNILAQEVDADIDAIYSAWNQGADTVNIKDGAVTTPKLAPGAITAGQIAAGSIGTAQLAPGAVTDANVTSVAWSKLISPFLQTLMLNPRGTLVVDGTNDQLNIMANAGGSPGYDSTRPTWLLRLDYSAVSGGDAFQVWRMPPGGSWALFCQVTNAGKLAATLADLSVTRGQLAVNAPVGNLCVGFPPTTFSLTTPNTWTIYLTMAPALVTRGGYVFLMGNGGLSVSGPVGGGLVYHRWVRDNAVIIATSSYEIASSGQGAQGYTPLPGLTCIDASAPAGSHSYAYQLMVQPNVYILGSGDGSGAFLGFEIG